MAQHSFNSLQSSSQATLICYRGPGCATQYKFETSGVDNYGSAKTLAEAQALASTDFRDQCKGFFIDDLSDTPFGDLTLGEGEDYTGGFAEICSGLVPSGTYSDCKFDDQIALIHMTGPEGSLQVDMTSWLLSLRGADLRQQRPSGRRILHLVRNQRRVRRYFRDSWLGLELRAKVLWAAGLRSGKVRVYRRSQRSQYRHVSEQGTSGRLRNRSVVRQV